MVGMINYGIWYDHDLRSNLLGYSDSDEAGCMEDTKIP